MTFEIKLAPGPESTANGTIVGYAALHGKPADDHGDLIERGAFDETLGTGRLPPMLLRHRGAPIGTWHRIETDEIGLKVEGTVTDPDVLADVRAGRVNGLSIGYVARRTTKTAGVRSIEALDLIEISLVRRPANQRAQILQVKGYTMDDQSTDNSTPDEAGELTTQITELTARVDKIDERLSTVEQSIAKQTKSIDGLNMRLSRPAVQVKAADGRGRAVQFYQVKRYPKAFEGSRALR